MNYINIKDNTNNTRLMSIEKEDKTYNLMFISNGDTVEVYLRNEETGHYEDTGEGMLLEEYDNWAQRYEIEDTTLDDYILEYLSCTTSPWYVNTDYVNYEKMPDFEEEYKKEKQGMKVA